MTPLHLLSYVFAGAVFTNATPHFIAGVMAQPFRTPFANPPGRGLSPPWVNMVWAVFNLLVAYALLCRVGQFSLQSLSDIAAVTAGSLLMGLHHSLHRTPVKDAG